MSKSSKKRKFPKISKLGKYFKLKRSSKKKNNEVDDNEDGGRSTPTCVPEYTQITQYSDEKEEQEDKPTLKEDVKIAEDQVKSSVIHSKKEKHVTKKTVTKDNIEANNGVCHVDNNTRSKSLVHEEHSNSISAADILVHASVPEKSIGEEITDPAKKCPLDINEENINADSGESAGTSSPKADDSMEEGNGLIYPVLVETPFQIQKQNDEDEESTSNDDNNVQNRRPIPCNVIVHTPQQKKTEESTSNDNNVQNRRPIPCNVIVHTPQQKKTEEKEMSISKTMVDDDDDFMLSELPETPSPKKPEKRGSRRVLTVKKIRSIIATPYKRLKRDSSSLMDGQTYRYIEIQSLVKAFETLHSCTGRMIACNEKGIQYGTSSVLRIECQDCNTKVFLQSTKH